MQPDHKNATFENVHEYELEVCAGGGESCIAEASRLLVAVQSSLYVHQGGRRGMNKTGSCLGSLLMSYITEQTTCYFVREYLFQQPPSEK